LTSNRSDLNGKRLLVTGGLGFVGSNIVEAAVAEDARVTVLDDLSAGRVANIVDGVEYRFVEGSVADSELVYRLVRESDYVAHLAARNIITSTKNPVDDCETNIRGTLNVLMAARRHGVQRMVYTSSASVYGNSKHLPVSEDETPRTFSPYSVSKLAGENYCYAFYESYGLPVACLRYSNVYGPKQTITNPCCGVVSRFIAAAMRGEPLPIHGDGQQTRDFTYVDDAVDATLLALVSSKSEGLIFNVGTGVESPVLQVAREVCTATGSPLRVEHIDRRDIDNIRRRVLNIELIRTRLRWQPQTALPLGVKRTVEWYVQQGDPVEMDDAE
jgi:UDP-glucose 4-epimerase